MNILGKQKVEVEKPTISSIVENLPLQTDLDTLIEYFNSAWSWEEKIGSQERNAISQEKDPQIKLVKKQQFENRKEELREIYDNCANPELRNYITEAIYNVLSRSKMDLVNYGSTASILSSLSKAIAAVQNATLEDDERIEVTIDPAEKHIIYNDIYMAITAFTLDKLKKQLIEIDSETAQATLEEEVARLKSFKLKISHEINFLQTKFSLIQAARSPQYSDLEEQKDFMTLVMCCPIDLHPFLKQLIKLKQQINNLDQRKENEAHDAAQRVFVQLVDNAYNCFVKTTPVVEKNYRIHKENCAIIINNERTLLEQHRGIMKTIISLLQVFSSNNLSGFFKTKSQKILDGFNFNEDENTNNPRR